MHHSRLKLKCKEQYISNIEEDFHHFLRALRGGYVPSESICAKLGSGTLRMAWALLFHGFKYLSKFCMGLSTVFPGTSTVEAVF